MGPGFVTEARGGGGFMDINSSVDLNFKILRSVASQVPRSAAHLVGPWQEC